MLESSRFAESKLREIPRLLKHFYRGGLRFRGNAGGDEPMRNFIAECKRAKAEMAAADASCDIGDGAFCYWVLEFSGLAEAEITYVLGQCEQKYHLDRVCDTLINLYPRGSERAVRHPGQGPSRTGGVLGGDRRRRWARNAEAEHDDDDDGEDGFDDADCAGGFTALEWSEYVDEQVTEAAEAA